MLKIRLDRHGKRNDPAYRIVVIDSARKRGGKPISVIGYWYPKKDDLKIDKKLYQEYLGNGAQPSPSLKKLLK